MQRLVMMRHFGVLVPSTNTTVEIEYGRLLPASLQVHVARIPLLSSGVETDPRGGDGDVDHQARLLGHARVEVVALPQTAASLSADDYDERIIRRMSEAASVPAITSARAIGLAVRALGVRRIAVVAPFPLPTIARLEHHFASKSTVSPVPTRSCTRRSGRPWHATPSRGPIGRRSKRSSFLAAIFRPWLSYRIGNVRSANLSSPPTRPRSGPCFGSCRSTRTCLASGVCWKRCQRCEGLHHRRVLVPMGFGALRHRRARDEFCGTATR